MKTLLKSRALPRKMFANNKNQLKLIGAIAFVGAGVVLACFPV